MTSIGLDDPEIRRLEPFDLLDEESERIAAFLEALGEDDWRRPTRAEGWTIRVMLAHLAGDEEYNRACLDDDLKSLFAQAAAAGARDMTAFNDWMIRKRADRPAAEVLAEWRESNADVRARMRKKGRRATLATSVGPYPVGLQCFHLASELATHADDMEIPVDPADAAKRLDWRARFSRFAVDEAERDVTIQVRHGLNYVVSGEREVILSDEELVQAVVARLPAQHELDAELREALRVLA